MGLAGEFDGAWQAPVVRARLIIRRLRVNRRIKFLVDTGAVYSLLSTSDAERLRIDVTRLRPGPLIGGVGGNVRPHVEPAALVFAEPGRIHIYRLNLLIASDGSVPRGLPSVIGRDILNRWHMTYRPTERRLEFDVVSADDSLALDI